MKIIFSLILNLIFVIMAQGQPHVIILPTPPPIPVPQPDNKPITTIQPNELYVIRSESHLTIIIVPENLVSISEDQGPVKIKSIFTGGTGKTETKTFKEKYIYELEVKEPGTGTIIIIPDNVKSKTELLLLPVITGIPPPPPKPPDPKPDAPIPDKGFRVGFIYEAGKTLPKGQNDIFSAKIIRDYLNSHCVKGTDGKTPEWRVFDTGLSLTSESQLWQTAYKRPHSIVPWIIISNGTTGFEGALPPNPEELLKILKEYGGD